ncbi:MAG TPA: hypothetical protein DD381_07295 [Lentisphaeria bacterium]|nr:MAG: hypothetical protein A2X47_05635 [Lentisphaerae bacterium GWF2_38_69]HBM16127.1 hypothetical protein [Lentisphaeria bacterium]
MLAIDQKGKSKTKLQETRLYIFCMIEGKIVKLLKMGNKNTQSDDIQKCIKIIEQTNKERGNG